MSEEEIEENEQQKKYYDINTTVDNTSLTSVLVIFWASDSAAFKCNFTNWKGSDHKMFELTVRGMSSRMIGAVVVSTVIIVILMALLVIFGKKTYNEKVKTIVRYFCIIICLSQPINFIAKIARFGQHPFKVAGRKLGQNES